MEIIVHHHLGLGDHFICNGLVNHLCLQYEKVYLACKKHNFPTVDHLYSNNNQVEVFKIEQEPQDIFDFSQTKNVPILHVGFQHCDLKSFESSFYKQLGLDPAIQYSGFKLPTNQDKSWDLYKQVVNQLGDKYIFVHDHSSQQHFPLQIQSQLPKYIVEKSQTDNVLDYVHVMRQAQEIHVINSSIQALVWPLLMQGYLSNMIYFHDFSSVYQSQSIPIRVPQHPLVNVVKYNIKI